jgi:hypothetical protein
VPLFLSLLIVRFGKGEGKEKERKREGKRRRAGRLRPSMVASGSNWRFQPSGCPKKAR